MTGGEIVLRPCSLREQRGAVHCSCDGDRALEVLLYGAMLTGPHAQHSKQSEWTGGLRLIDAVRHHADCSLHAGLGVLPLSSEKLHKRDISQHVCNCCRVVASGVELQRPLKV